MTKKIIFAGIAMLFAASCSNDNDVNVINSDELVPVTVHVDAFSVEQGEFPAIKATAIGDYATVKAITLAFYKSDGTQAYKHTQFKADASTFTTYGEFSTSLTAGNYTLVVLGYGQGTTNEEITLTSPTSAGFTGTVRETFAYTEPVVVNTSTPLDISATLDRIVSKVSVKSTDGRSADVKTIRVSMSGGSKSFNPTTGLATDNNGFANSVVTSTAVGNTTNIGSALFLITDEQNVNVTIETLDNDDNVLFSKTVNNVPLKRNRVTTLTGAMYSVTGTANAGSFQVNTDWLTPEDDIVF
ncbi:MAG: FimB/Mfa2 family fimbrial subunit [Bacteroidaceae bacterium]|nr:FimB/Mfa2 family fimbrial subunit [Bacteroidaceae bacterium]